LVFSHDLLALNGTKLGQQSRLLAHADKMAAAPARMAFLIAEAPRGRIFAAAQL
jgi:hypothetical protein